MAASKAPVLDPVIMAKAYESGNFKTCFDLTIASFSLSLHSFDLCDLPIGVLFKALSSQPGRLAQGPLEKLGFNGLFIGLTNVIIIQNPIIKKNHK